MLKKYINIKAGSHDTAGIRIAQALIVIGSYIHLTSEVGITAFSARNCSVVSAMLLL